MIGNDFWDLCNCQFKKEGRTQQQHSAEPGQHEPGSAICNRCVRQGASPRVAHPFDSD